MSEQYLLRVLAAVQALAVRGESITTHAIGRVTASRSTSTIMRALAVLRERGYVTFADGAHGTIRYTEARLYE